MHPHRWLIVVASVTLAACSTPTDNDNDPGIANPASTYCVEHGGQLEIVTTSDGQLGICRFPDGSSCDEWAYYRGECKPGDNP